MRTSNLIKLGLIFLNQVMAGIIPASVTPKVAADIESDDNKFPYLKAEFESNSNDYEAKLIAPDGGIIPLTQSLDLNANAVHEDLYAVDELPESAEKYAKDFLSLFPGQELFRRTHFDVIHSTQDYIREHIDELFAATNKVVVTANEQTKGRGTKSKRWASPPDVNIYATFGIVLPDESIAELQSSSIFDQIVALAVSRTLKDFDIHANIKWINDVRVGKKKICGILCEPDLNQAPLKTHDDRSVALIGIGLNVNMNQTVCDSITEQAVTSMTLEAKKPFDKEEVFARLQLHLEGHFKLYLTKGSFYFKNEIEYLLEGIGKTIRVINKDSEHEATVEGELIGIDRVGRLLLKLPDENIMVITNGQIVKDSLIEPISTALPTMSMGGGS